MGTIFETIRFIVVGIINTIFYYLLYIIFTEMGGLYYLVGHWLAFLISMVGSFFLNTYFTYQTKPSWKKFFQFPLTNIVNIVVSSSALFIFKEYLQFDNKIAPLLAAGIAVPFTYFISRKILKSKG